MECVYGKCDDLKFHFDNENVRCSMFIVCMSIRMGMNLYIPVLKNGTSVPSGCLYLLILCTRIREFPFVSLYVACLILKPFSKYVACEYMEWKLACMCCATVIHWRYAVCETRATLTFIYTYNHVYHCIGSNKWTTYRINVVYIHIIFGFVVLLSAEPSIMCHCANANKMKILYQSGNSLFVVVARC